MAHKAFTFEEVGPELARVLQDETAASTASVSQTYLLMQACQLLVTHPGISTAITLRYRALGRALQDALRVHVSEYFMEFCEAGWNEEYDVDGDDG